MRTRELWTGAAALLLAVNAVAQELPKNPPVKPSETKPPAKPAPNSLDAIIADALKHNPDIQAAQARLREAEIQVNKIRSEVMVNVAAQYEVVRNAKEMIRAMESTQQKKDQLFKTGQLSALEYWQSQTDLFRARSEVAKIEGELTKLVGRVPGQPNQAASINQVYDGLVAVDLGWYLDPSARSANRYLAYPNNTLWLYQPANNVNFAPEWKQSLTIADPRLAPTPSASISDKLRAALTRPLKIDREFKNAQVQVVLDYLKEHGLKDVPVRIMLGNSKTAHETIDLMTAELPLGAWLVAVQDSVPELRVVVREYGLLITTADRVPADGLMISQFLRQAKAQEVKKDEKPKQ